MITTDFIYIFLNLLALFIFIIAGQNIASNEKKYWNNAIWCIVAFTLLLGLRLNRGNDYGHYMSVYNYDLEAEEVLFTSFNHVLKSIGVGAHWIFMYYSCAYIIGAMILLKEFRRYAKWLFPLFLIAFTYFSEYMIRQAFGFTFVFIMIKFMIDEKLKLKAKIIRMGICFFLAYSIHTANAVTSLLIIGVYYLMKFPLPFKITIPAFIFASYFFSELFDFSYLDGILAFLGDSSTKFSQYTDNSSRWFSADAMDEIYVRKPIVKLFQTCGECSLFYLGNKVLQLRPNQKFLFVYNFYVIGTIFDQCFYTVEILRRMGDIMFYFWAFPLAYVLKYKNVLLDSCKKNIIKSLSVKFTFLSLSFYLYDYIKYLFFRNVDDFIWNL